MPGLRPVRYAPIEDALSPDAAPGPSRSRSSSFRVREQCPRRTSWSAIGWRVLSRHSCARAGAWARSHGYDARIFRETAGVAVTPVACSTGEEGEIRDPETRSGATQPEVQVQEVEVGEGFRIAVVGAGGCGRMVLDVLLACGYESWIMGFYDDAHAVLPREVRGFPVLGDTWMLKSLLSVESVFVVVAITDNAARLRVANSIRSLGGQFMSAVHPHAYVSPEATLGDGSVVCAGAVLHPDVALGSHCMVGPGAVLDRDVSVGAGAWLSAGAVVGSAAGVGARASLGYNSVVGRKASLPDGARVEALRYSGPDDGA